MGSKAPRVMVFNGLKNKIVSVRWFVDFDYIKEENYSLIQFGKNPVKFACFVGKDCRPPTFLYSVRWFTKLGTRRIRIGYTEKPIDTSKFWRKQCRHVTDLDHYRSTSTLKSRTSSKIGPTPQIAE